MSEQRTPYLAGDAAPTYRVKLSYHLTYQDGRLTTEADELLVEAHSGDLAAVIALAQLDKFKPRAATITNLQLTVSLEI